MKEEDKETIINFNEGEPGASIFTYNKSWQRHLEQRLGLKPVMSNRFGGREYVLPKSRVKPPRAPKNLAAETKKKMIASLGKARQQKSILSSKSHNTMRKSAHQNRNPRD